MFIFHMQLYNTLYSTCTKSSKVLYYYKYRSVKPWVNIQEYIFNTVVLQLHATSEAKAYSM